MISSTWKGFAAGLGLFSAVAGVTLLTPARPAVLKALGRDHAALRLERRLVAALPAETPAAELKARRRALENRFESWERRNARLSAFSVAGGVFDLWPWLFGLGLALPVFGALIGAQVGRDGRDEARLIAPVAADPTRSEGRNSVDPPYSEDAPTTPKETPPPPETWSWNAKPAARTTPARPKPPAVESPHLKGEE